MRIQVEIEGQAPEEREITKFPASIGRMEDNTLAFPDILKMSRYHAELRKEGDAVVLYDLQSHSGTSIDGKPIEQETLVPGTSFAIDRVTFTLMREGEGAAPAAAEKPKQPAPVEKPRPPEPAEAPQTPAEQPAAQEADATMIVAPDEEKTQAVSPSDLVAHPEAIPIDQPGMNKVTIPDGESSVGRSDSNDLVVQSSSVSRRHAVFSFVDGVLTVTDTGSKNGTRVNRKKAAPHHALKHGDVVTFGSVSFKIEWPTSSVAVETDADKTEIGRGPGKTEVFSGQPRPQAPVSMRAKPTVSPLFIGALGVIAVIVVIVLLYVFLSGPDKSITSGRVTEIDNWYSQKRSEELVRLDGALVDIADNLVRASTVTELNNISKQLNSQLSSIDVLTRECQKTAQAKKWVQEEQYTEIMNALENMRDRADIKLKELTQNRQRLKEVRLKELKAVLLSGGIRTSNRLAEATESLAVGKRAKDARELGIARRACDQASAELSNMFAVLTQTSADLEDPLVTENEQVRFLSRRFGSIEKELAATEEQIIGEAQRERILASMKQLQARADKLAQRRTPSDLANAMKLISQALELDENDTVGKQLSLQSRLLDLEAEKKTVEQAVSNMKGKIEEARTYQQYNLDNRAIEIYAGILQDKVYTNLPVYREVEREYNELRKKSARKKKQ